MRTQEQKHREFHRTTHAESVTANTLVPQRRELSHEDEENGGVKVSESDRYTHVPVMDCAESTVRSNAMLFSKGFGEFK